MLNIAESTKPTHDKLTIHKYSNTRGWKRRYTKTFQSKFTVKNTKNARKKDTIG